MNALHPFAEPELSPGIVLGKSDHHRASVAALAGSGHTAEDSDFLLWELDRARLVPDEALPAGVVRIGARVCYRDQDGTCRSVRLVLAADEATGPDVLSVLTPEGTALLGLSEGQTMSWREPGGGRHRSVAVISVTPPAPTAQSAPSAHFGARSFALVALALGGLLLLLLGYFAG